MSAVINDELTRISNSFIADGLSSREYRELDTRIGKWNLELRDLFEEELIEILALESFYYIERAEFWINYLKKQIAKQPRKQVIDVLTLWQQPFLLFGQITQELENELIVKDDLRDISYAIPGKITESHLGEWMLGIVLPDSRRGEHGLTGTDGIMFIHNDSSGIVARIRDTLKSSDKDVLDVYRLFGQMEKVYDFTTFQQQVVDLTQQYLADHSYEEDIVLPMLTGFLLNNEVNAKKPSAVAAGVIQVAHDFELIGSAYSTLKEIGAYFNVSSATVSKYRDQVGDFVMSKIEHSKEENSEQIASPELSVDIGTDPRGTERFMWEMVKRTQQQSFETAESLNAFLSGKMNEEYQPVNKEEQAQLFCYKAYEAETEELRVQLANEAADKNSNIADVHLLLAEQSTHKIIKENHYLKAIRSSIENVDFTIDQAWNYVLNRPYLRALFTYGAWLITENRHTDALKQFSHIFEINPQDHQGVRWLLVVTYMHLGFYEEADQVLNQLNSDNHQAIFFYLELVMDRKELDLAINHVDMSHGEKLNKHVIAMVAEGKDPGAFPRSLTIQAGSMDEAKLIYWMISGLI
ncbi:tetratricopeptide repeat protein [Paenisporosarcina antarctica]|uniref:tetratricopeptide repeat protein n=1 Tax=Paenisporosarcina antarctica TaxID=417367 RepID=UPI001FB93822|nr:tetratricopeptide repeat protein [Paenisporosarcina antarctica]